MAYLHRATFVEEESVETFAFLTVLDYSKNKYNGVYRIAAVENSQAGVEEHFVFETDGRYLYRKQAT